jgi:hypothetical protein
VVAAEDTIGNDIGFNHDNGVKPLAVDLIDNDIGVNHDNGAKSLVIGDDYGGRDSVIKPIGSSLKPNQVNNDNVAKGILAWPKLKPIFKVLGTSSWLKPINISNAKSTSAKNCGGGGDGANRINISTAKSTSANHGGGGDSANRIKIANAKSTLAKHRGGGGDSANRIKIANVKSTLAKHCGDGDDDSARMINIANAKSTSAKHYGGGDSASSVAGDNGMAHSTDVDACLPVWAMKTDAPPH